MLDLEKMGRRGERETEESAVPDTAVEPVIRAKTDLEDLETNLVQFLSMADPDVIAELPPLQRARVFLVLANSASTLFTVRLRCHGIQPDNHPVKTELERLRLYEEKFERYSDWNRAPLRPSTTVNYKAATRFIEHSLPDLTAEQRKSMREISRGEGLKSRFREKHAAHRKRKYQHSEKQSVRAAAQEFLEKAARELLGSENCGMKGPLRLEASDDEDALTN